MTEEKLAGPVSPAGFAARGLSSLWQVVSSTVVGLLSGAVLVYLSPLVNGAIKPPRPVPNFAYTVEGMQVTFANHSTGGTQGWWDFGDGTALEPFSPNQADFVHRFPAAGSYSVKLVLSNLIGEDADRTVSLKVDPTASSTPTIRGLQAICKTTTVPATVTLLADVRNADTVLWNIDDLPVVVDDVPSNGQMSRIVTFTYYGTKTIRLIALNGKSHVEASTEVWVDVPEDTPQILVYATETPTRVRMVGYSVLFPAMHGGDTYPFAIERKPHHSNEVIVEAHLDKVPSEDKVRNPRLLVASDRRSFRLQGELVRGTAGATPSWCGNIELKTMSASAAATPTCEPLSKALTLPGRTVLDLPPTFLAGAKGVQWELRQGMDVLMRDGQAPTTAVTQQVQMGGRSYRMQVQQVGSQIVIDAVPAAPTATPVPGTATSIGRPE
jgi:PKD domain